MTSPGIPLSQDDLLYALHHSLGATVCIVDRNWVFRYVNAGFAVALKVSAEEAAGRPVLDFYDQATVDYLAPLAERVYQGETVTYERRGRIHDDENAWISVTLAPWKARDGTIHGFITSSLRVHELRLATERLHAATSRLASHVENSPLTVLELDAQLGITRASPRAQGMLGAAPSQLVGKNLADVLSAGGATPNLLQSLTRLQLQQEPNNRAETPFTRPDGSSAHLAWFNSALVSSEDGTLTLLCLVEDVTAQRAAEAQLRHMATHDALTGLLNRKGLTETLTDLLNGSQGSNTTVACLYIDLDGFKEVNDRYGHAAGDALLVEVSARFRALARPHDAVARMGGDEFVVVQSSGTHAQALALAEALVKSLHAPCVLEVGGKPVQASVRASVGVASTPTLPAQSADLLKRADAAMYEAKRAGKDCVRVA
jgi:diguanylate cyclase (GGDEF)-like protein/PAS domain S-box-containing protein